MGIVQSLPMESLPILLSLLCLVLFVTASTKAVDESYCNTQMNTGNISLPLPKAKLTQVQTFIRHGARVRWSPQQCWPEDHYLPLWLADYAWHRHPREYVVPQEI